MTDTSKTRVLTMCYAAPLATNDAGIPETVELIQALAAERDALAARLAEAERQRDGAVAALSGHQAWDTAEKLGPDEFVLWAPDGHVCLRLKVTHKNEHLDAAGLEFVTCDLLDLMNARTALNRIKETRE